MENFVYDYISFCPDGSVLHIESLLTEAELRGAIKYSKRSAWKYTPITHKIKKYKLELIEEDLEPDLFYP